MAKETYDNITPNPKFIPDNTWFEAFDDEICPFVPSAARLLKVTVEIFGASLTSKV